LREAFHDDLEERIVFFPSEIKVKDWLSSYPFGEEVYEAFPSAKSDLSWAALSFITDNWTGCVFYLMRAIEQVMRELASHLGIKSISRKSPIPVEYAEWGVVCGALKTKIDALQQKKRGAKKSAELKFYSDAASQIDWFNEIWRKNVAHARTLYRDSDADNAMRRAKDFLQLLATRMSEKS